MHAFEILGHRGVDWLGIIPFFLDEKLPGTAREQLHANYGHGGGWQPFEGFEIDKDGVMHYPGDPALKPVAKTMFRDETVYVYEYGWVTITQPDGSTSTCRMD